MELGKKEAGAFISGGGAVSWVALVEYGFGRYLEANALGLAGVIADIGVVEYALFRGFARFLANLVDALVGRAPLVVMEAWADTPAEGLGALAPLLVMLQVLTVGYAVYGVFGDG